MDIAFDHWVLMPNCRYLLHKTRLVTTGLLKKEVDRTAREYWARRTVGGSTWQDLDDEARQAHYYGLEPNDCVGTAEGQRFKFACLGCFIDFGRVRDAICKQSSPRPCELACLVATLQPRATASFIDLKETFA